ncbi:hypothetical protein QWJ07_09185 [Frankia sp. RB7]|nr:hypothetical protein [Frankia sp. RB7]
MQTVTATDCGHLCFKRLGALTRPVTQHAIITQQDFGRILSAKFLLRKSTTPAWIAMIATELN